MALRFLHRLDDVQRLQQLDAFDADAFLRAANDELAALPTMTLELVAEQLDAPREILAALDAFTQKSAHIRLNQITLPAPLQLLVKTTIGSYVGKLELLRARVFAGLQRVDPQAPATTNDVITAAELVLAQDERLRRGVLGIVTELANAQLANAAQHAQNRLLADGERVRWAKARIDLEHVAADPRRIASAALLDRIAQIPVDEIPREPEPEPDSNDTNRRFSLIEID